MKLEGTATFAAPRERVWQILQDPQALAHCLPGCEAFEETGPNAYHATLKVGVAGVKGTYTGKVVISDQSAPQSYRLQVDGTGAPGFVKGDALMELTEEQPNKTLLRWSADVMVGGTVAGVGQRMLGGVAKLLAGQFFKCMEQRLKEKEAVR